MSENHPSAPEQRRVPRSRTPVPARLLAGAGVLLLLAVLAPRPDVEADHGTYVVLDRTQVGDGSVFQTGSGERGDELVTLQPVCPTPWTADVYVQQSLDGSTWTNLPSGGGPLWGACPVPAQTPGTYSKQVGGGVLYRVTIGITPVPTGRPQVLAAVGGPVQLSLHPTRTPTPTATPTVTPTITPTVTVTPTETPTETPTP